MKQITLFTLALIFVFSFTESRAGKYQKEITSGISMLNYKKKFNDDGGIKMGIGVGAGLPYGVIGGKIVLTDTRRFELSGGFGITPLAWEPTFTGTGSILFKSKSERFAPKISLAVSNCAAVIIFMDESFSALYEKTYSGFAPYLGGNIYFNDERNFILEINIGYIITFEGNKNFIDKYNEEMDNLKNSGYVINEKFNSIYLPKLSVGFIYLF